MSCREEAELARPEQLEALWTSSVPSSLRTGRARGGWQPPSREAGDGHGGQCLPKSALEPRPLPLGGL